MGVQIFLLWIFFPPSQWSIFFSQNLVNSDFAGKTRMVYELCETDDFLQAEETRTDIHAESVNLTGDGSLDRHGQIADKRKTGGWRAAPLIFGTNFSFEYNLTTLMFLNYICCWATENCGIVACHTNGPIFGMMMVMRWTENHQN
jgi:hypothetical protein